MAIAWAITLAEGSGLTGFRRVTRVDACFLFVAAFFKGLPAAFDFSDALATAFTGFSFFFGLSEAAFAVFTVG